MEVTAGERRVGLVPGKESVTYSQTLWGGRPPGCRREDSLEEGAPGLPSKPYPQLLPGAPQLLR